jgi:peroxiredoxin
MADVPGPGVGASAPEFFLRRTFEESIGLSNLVAGGPLLLAFYVFDFGPV